MIKKLQVLHAVYKLFARTVLFFLAMDLFNSNSLISPLFYLREREIVRYLSLISYKNYSILFSKEKRKLWEEDNGVCLMRAYSTFLWHYYVLITFI